MKNIVTLNKPIYVGMAILELSKLHMAQFYYDVLKPKYGNRIKMLYTDTDSFILYVETEDVYKDLKDMNSHMDFSDYPIDHPNYDDSNKKAIGKMKDELNGKIMTEYIGLRSKMYTYKTEDGECSKKAKGVPKHVVNKKLTFDRYLDALDSNKKDNVTFHSIRSQGHKIHSLTHNKASLGAYCNKRHYIDNSESYPYGHWRLTI